MACLGFVLLLSCLGLKQSLNVGSCFVLDFERLNYGIFFHARKLLKDRQSRLQMKLKF